MKFDHGDATHAGAFSIGGVLRQAREARGESVGDVAHALKLNPRQVEAIEQERFDLLPGKAFVRGFVRNYARHVGLDAEQLVTRLPDASPAGGVQSMELTPPHNARGTLPSGSEPARQAPRGVFVLLLAAVAVLGVAWYFDWFNVAHLTQSAAERVGVQTVREPMSLAAPATGEVRADSAPTVVAPLTMVPAQTVVATPLAAPPAPTQAATVPVVIPPVVAPTPVTEAARAQVEPGTSSVAAQPAPSVAVTPVPALTETPAPAVVAPTANDVGASAEVSPAQPGQLVFQLRGESWIQVRDASGNMLYMGTGAAGTTRTVQGTPPFSVVVGNAAQVTLEHGGKPFDLTPYTRNGGVARATVE